MLGHIQGDGVVFGWSTTLGVYVIFDRYLHVVLTFNDAQK